MLPFVPADDVIVSVWIYAEQLAVVPPFAPLQLHVHGPVPLTAVAVPELQIFVLGAVVNVCKFELPQDPLTALAVKLADMVWFAITLLKV